MAVLVLAIGFAVDLDGFLTNPYIPLEFGFGGPGDFLFEGTEIGFFHLVGGSFLLGLILTGEFSLQLGVLCRRNRAVGF